MVVLIFCKYCIQKLESHCNCNALKTLISEASLQQNTLTKLVANFPEKHKHY